MNSEKKQSESTKSKTTEIHKEEIKRAQNFNEKNGTLSLFFILLDWIAIFTLIFISEYFWHPLLYILVLWLIGGRMIALSDVFGHDSVHYNLFKKRSLNYQLQFMWFFPLFETWERYREEHFRHHSKLLTPEDPAYVDYKRWGLFNKNNNYYWVWFIRPFLLFDTPYFISYTIRCMIKDKKYRWQLLIYWALIFAACTLTGTLKLLLMYWFVPMLWCYPALLFWSETGEHFRADDGEKTRSTYGFLEWLFISPHDDRFHYVHHRFPQIPWFSLKKATQELVPDSPRSDGFVNLFYQVKDETRNNYQEAKESKLE